MIISPTKAIENGWVTGEISNDSIQPNGIDFRLTRLFVPATLPTGGFVLREREKLHSEYVETLPYYIETKLGAIQGWRLKPRTSYDFISNLNVKLPNNVAALIIQRSTLNRNSIVISSGLWDSGFNGVVSGQINNNANQSAIIEANVRIGQVYFIEAQSAHLYQGQYQGITDFWGTEGK